MHATVVTFLGDVVVGTFPALEIHVKILDRLGLIDGSMAALLPSWGHHHGASVLLACSSVFLASLGDYIVEQREYL
jgi:hypothetical protein